MSMQYYTTYQKTYYLICQVNWSLCLQKWFHYW